MTPQNYRLKGAFDYQILISEYDGWDYKFPVLDPIRLGEIAKRTNPEFFPHAADGQWLDAKTVEKQMYGDESWVPTDDFILHMRPRDNSKIHRFPYIGRFSYEPESMEFLMGGLNQKHAEIIDKFGNHFFNNYVRGIYLREKGVILIRAYYNPLDEQGLYHDEWEYDPKLDQKKTDRTLEMLIKNNLPSHVSVVTRVTSNKILRLFDPNVNV
jgi:hypothetical protein